MSKKTNKCPKSCTIAMFHVYSSILFLRKLKHFILHDRGRASDFCADDRSKSFT